MESKCYVIERGREGVTCIYAGKDMLIALAYAADFKSRRLHVINPNELIGGSGFEPLPEELAGMWDAGFSILHTGK